MTKEWLRRLLFIGKRERPTPVAPGLYHMMQEGEGTIARFHLRVERDGSGMLIANAVATARLTPTGVIIAKGLLEGASDAQIAAMLRKHFSRTDPGVITADIERVRTLIKQITEPGDLYPIFNLEDATFSPYRAELIAPLQASLPLREGSAPQPILDRLWEVGIPHVTFLYSDTSQPSTLVHAIERAEDLGMIAGVRARATHLADVGFLTELMQAGVDHVDFLYASHQPEVHDALCGEGDLTAARWLLDWLEENELCAVAEIPLVQATLDELEITVAELLDHGADNLSFVAYATTDPDLAIQDGIFAAPSMVQVAATVEEIAHMTQARFMWNPPVERDPRQPLASQIKAGPRCTGDVAIRVEPNGDVIPPRGPARSAGNILRDPWEAIWESEPFRAYRERVESPTRCDICPGLTICAADCPKNPAGWARFAVTSDEAPEK